MFAQNHFKLFWLLTLFTLLGLAASSQRALAAVTLTVANPGTITTDSRPTVTVTLAGGAANPDTVTLSLLNGVGGPVSNGAVLTSLGAGLGGGSNFLVATGDGTYSFTNLHITKPGSYELKAMVTVGTDLGVSGTSTAFTVNAGAPNTVVISAGPTPASLTADGTFSLSATVKDMDGNPLSDGTPVSLTLYDSTGTTPIVPQTILTGQAGIHTMGGLGVATFSALGITTAGAYTVKATSGGITSLVSGMITVTPGVAFALKFVNEPPATATSNTNFASPTPVTVQLIDDHGNNVHQQNVSVTLSLNAADANPVGTLSGTFTGTFSNKTDATGLATFTNLKVDKFGVKTLTADTGITSSVDSTPFTVNPGAAALLAFVTQPTNTPSGSPFTVTVQVEDSAGNPVADNAVPVTLTLNQNTFSGGATTVTVNTNSSGLASFSGVNALVIATEATGYTLTASSTGAGLTTATAVSNPFNVTAGTPARLAFVTQPTTTASHTPINPPVTVQVEDGAGNPVADNAVPVTLTLNQNTFSGGAITVTASTNSSGLATFTGVSALVIDTAATGYTLTASSTGAGLTTATAVSSPFNITFGAVTTLSFVQPPTMTAAGATITPAVTVQAVDAHGNPVAGAGVTLTISTGNGTLNGAPTQTTNAMGIATFSNLSIDRAGSKVLTASSGGVTATSGAFQITAGTATQILYAQQPSNATAGAPITPTVVVQALDASSNPVSGVSVTLTLTGTGALSGTTIATTDSLGNATFSNLSINLAGLKQLTASATGVTSIISNTFTINAGLATQISFTQQPITAHAGSIISPPVVVQLLDANNNPVGGASVSVALSGGPGALSGTTTATTDGLGNATFSNLSVNAVGSGYVLTASSGALTPVASNPFAITPGAATQISYTQQPSDATAGATITPPVVLHVLDASNNPVPNVNVTLTKAVGPGTLGGTLTVATDANGNATFSDLVISQAGAYQLSAATAGVTSIGSVVFTIAPGAGTLSFQQPPPVSSVSGAPLTPPVQILLQDTNHNPVPNVMITLSLSGGAAMAVLSGNAPQTTNASGVATFNSLSVDKAGTGYVLTASTTGVTPAPASITSNMFSITPGTPTQIIFTQQPSPGANFGFGAPLPNVSVQLLDAAGNPVPNTSVSLSFATVGTGSNGTLPQLNLTVPTDPTGTATFSGLSIAASGPAQFKATGGGLVALSNGFTIGNPTATIAVLSPKFAHAGDPPVTLSITGSGFAQGAVVTFNGQPSDAATAPQITNVSVTANLITAQIATSLIQTAGTVTVTVTNQGPGISPSTPANFLVLPLGPTADPAGTAHTADPNGNTEYFDPGLQLFSVPFDYTADAAGTALGINDALRLFSLPDLMDTGDQGKVAVWNPSVADYDVTPMGNAKQLVLGQGYWGRFLYTPSGTGPRGETGLKTRGPEASALTDARKLNSQNQFSIPLKPGWNMIGDPFNNTVNLNEIQVQDANGNVYTSLVDANNQGLVNQTFYKYAPLTGGTYGYVAVSPTNRDVLTAYVGYWVHAYQPCTLLVPSH